MTMQTITARIYWDDADPNNVGWAWSTRVDGEHDDSGPLDGMAQDASREALIGALRSQVLTASAAVLLADSDVVIVR